MHALGAGYAVQAVCGVYGAGCMLWVLWVLCMLGELWSVVCCHVAHASAQIVESQVLSHADVVM